LDYAKIENKCCLDLEERDGVSTLTLHKFFSSSIVDMREIVVFSGQMLDA
jgi:hypothetical protein